MKGQSRREFLKNAGAAGVIALTPPSAAGSAPESKKRGRPFELGLASYTLRSFTLDQVIETAKRIELRTLTLKDMHLPLKSTDEELAAAKAKITAAGLQLDSVGVVYMKTEEEVRQAFAYARKAGAKMIVGGPDPEVLPACERMVKETEILLAIHNHGPTDKNYPSPESAYKAVAQMDRRMGLCIDIAHTQRMGLDPAEQFAKCFARTFDIHIKDVTASDPNGGPIEIGRGVIDIPGFLRVVAAKDYLHALHFEFEKDPKDPMQGLAESVGYVRGVLAAI